MKKVKIKKKSGSKPDLPVGGYGFVIGNGTTRAGKNIQQLMDYGIVYGCNWFFKEEFPPHVLVCSDEPMTKSVCKGFPNYPKRNWMYSWFPKPGSGVKKATCPEKFAAGPMATELAAGKHKAKKVFLIGIDFFGFGSTDKMRNGQINNLYAGKKNYVPAGKTPAPTYRNWQRRFEWILRHYPNTEFYHVDPLESKSPERLRGFPNFHQVSFSNLEDHLLNDAPLVDLLVKTPEDIKELSQFNEDDLRACLERQIAGQENVIFKDMLTDEQVFNLRASASIKAAQSGRPDAMLSIRIYGFDIMVPGPLVKTPEGIRPPNEIESRGMFEKEKARRAAIHTKWKQAGLKPKKITVVGAPPVEEKPMLPGLGGLPLPPPPAMSLKQFEQGSSSVDLPPPPPPPTMK